MNNSEQKKSSSAHGGELDGNRGPVVDQAKHALTTVANQAREQMTHRIDAQRDRAVETIGDVAGAIRETGEKLDGIGPLGDVAGRAADGMERLAKFFEGKQVTDIVRDVERFARREPAIFLGAAFAVGLIGGRFLKSSSAHGDEDARFANARAQRDSAWAAGDDGYLSSDDLEDYESRRHGAEGFSSGIPRIETDGPSIAPSPIVNAAQANESKTAPMPATQGSPGASASTSPPSAPFGSGSGNGSTGRT